jgi:hypothetical protein
VRRRGVAAPVDEAADPLDWEDIARELAQELIVARSMTSTRDARRAAALERYRRATHHCPRSASCVRAHDCRACGADRGESCRPAEEAA